MAKTPPLVFEELQDELNCIFLTLIEYKRVKYLTIVENVSCMFDRIMPVAVTSGG